MSDDRRLFVAVMAPPAVQAAAQTAIDILCAAAPVRWSDTDGVHVTLHFLGATALVRLPALTAALAEVARVARPLTLRTGDLGAFPSPARARVIWLGLTGDVAALARLQAAVTAATGPLGFVVETRPFTPHLTLGRVRDTATPAERAAIGQIVTASAAPPAVAWPVDELRLMRSTLGPRGATYSVVGRWPLGSSPAR